MLQGRQAGCALQQRAVWLSVSRDLGVDARRDLNDIGATETRTRTRTLILTVALALTRGVRGAAPPPDQAAIWPDRAHAASGGGAHASGRAGGADHVGRALRDLLRSGGEQPQRAVAPRAGGRGQQSACSVSHDHTPTHGGHAQHHSDTPAGYTPCAHGGRAWWAHRRARAWRGVVQVAAWLGGAKAEGCILCDESHKAKHLAEAAPAGGAAAGGAGGGRGGGGGKKVGAQQPPTNPNPNPNPNPKPQPGGGQQDRRVRVGAAGALPARARRLLLGHRRFGHRADVLHAPAGAVLLHLELLPLTTHLPPLTTHHPSLTTPSPLVGGRARPLRISVPTRRPSDCASNPNPNPIPNP